MRSDDYHDYVFKDGKLLGQFDDMYRYAKDVPWHQDKTAYQVFVDLDIAIVRHFIDRFGSRSLCDIGCGMGYVTARLRDELGVMAPGLKVAGIDISEAAVEKARLLHKNIDFFGINILRDDLSDFVGRFDFIYMKDVLWYVTEDASEFFDRARSLLAPGGGFYILQSLPDRVEYIGSDRFPDAFSIADFLKTKFVPVYVSSTYEINTDRVVGDYAMDKYLRFLGRCPLPTEIAPITKGF